MMGRPIVTRGGPRDQGIALIELVVVVLAMGVVATIAVPMFLGISGRGHDVAARSGVRALSRIHASAQEEGAQPTTIEQLEAAGFRPSPDIEYGLCARRHGARAAFAARHVNTQLVWLLDGDGRLERVTAPDVTEVLMLRPECPDVAAVDTVD